MEKSKSEILHGPLPYTHSDFCQKIKLRDPTFPSPILHKISQIFNKLHGVKQIEKQHRIQIETDTIETIDQSNEADKHVNKIYIKVDEAAKANLQLIIDIIEHYKNKK